MLAPLLRWLSQFFPRHRIPRDGKPYNDRYFILGRDGRNWAWGWLARSPINVFLHNFRDSDSAERLHDHPYRWSLSVILSGGYREERMTEHGGLFGGLETRTLRAGRINWIGPRDWHRIELLPGEQCWTLFISSARKPKTWSFINRFTLERELASGRT